MGLVVGIVTLPLAPFRGVGWVIDKVVRAAEEEYYDPAPVQEALISLERARDEGQIDDEEFARHEEALLHRLEEIRVHQLQRGAQPGL
ncbi:gas vesicle protein GvpG [Streptomyces sp. B93]|uniref:gas vesicle protein GvpG n=1 Tax=Streptomyces sp. B93 TaxID=2824875 RepID=UPI001B37B4CA|nr:gas vesicle protein GvpG [Streptomyces sp. B93]MBQ1090706.1 gas vesicle protein GvpG [Streptomyces sp. B93]